MTAFDAHLVQAFERGAIGYVLKPFNEARLYEIVERLKSRFQTGPSAILPNLDAAAKQSHTGPDDSDQLNMILRQLTAQIKPGAPHLQWIKASVGQTIRLIPIGDVFYFPSDENTHALCLKMVKC